MANAKKQSEKEVVRESVAEKPREPTELENAQARQNDLLRLRKEMTDNGIDSVGKLDNVLSQVNERIRQLSQ